MPLREDESSRPEGTRRRGTVIKQRPNHRGPSALGGESFFSTDTAKSIGSWSGLIRAPKMFGPGKAAIAAEDRRPAPCTKKGNRALGAIIYIARFIASLLHGMNNSSSKRKTVSNSCPLTDSLCSES